MKAGLNLFSLRELVQTQKGFAEVLRKVRQMGYSYIQISGVPLSPQVIAQESDDAGLPIKLTHSSLDRILNDTDGVMAENAVFGCKNIGLGYFLPETVCDEKKCKDTIAKLNEVAVKMKKEGFTFFLHHHHNEFLKYGNQTVFDYILENAPEIHFVVDTYWLQYGGVNTVGFLDRLKGKAECMHLKDYKLRPQKDSAWCEPHFAPVGSGTLDFSSIVTAALQAGTQYFFVEQDDASDYADPLGEVNKSIDYIKENL